MKFIKKFIEKIFNKELVNKERFNKKRVDCFKKTFGIAVGIVLVLLCGIWYLSEYLERYTTADMDFPLGIQMENHEEYMEKQKEVDSDISGMSVYDKYIMGLEVQEGSDSDYDGLTDKEEIEVYGTNPLAASTAGDLYSDSYKIEQGLDVFSYIEYEGELEFPYIECKEVSVVPVTPTDFNTVVKDYTDMFSLEKHRIKKIYKGYCLYNYGGTVTIDITDILEKYDITFKNIEIYVVEGLYVMPGVTELNKCKYERKDNQITLDYAFESNKQYLIYITSKKQLSFTAMLEDVTDGFWVNAVNSDEETEEIKCTGIIYGSPILQLLGIQVKAYYGETKNDEKNDIIYEHFMRYCDDYHGISISNKHIFGESEVKIKAKQKMMDSFLSYFECPTEDHDITRIRYLFFVYTKYEDVCNNNEDKIEETTANAGFDKMEDELPFQNFESYISPYGNCAGISHLTAYLYNKKELPSEGSYSCEIDGKMQDITWNLSSDVENETLQNPGLADYKTKNFIDDISTPESNFIQNGLSEGEKEFVNMIGCFWAEGNSKIDSSHLKPSGTLEDYSILENMMEYIDSGKIIDVYMYMRHGGGHAVNIYGYEHTKYKDQTIFYIYDSNIPQDKRTGFNVDRTNGTCMLHTLKIIDRSGNEKFIYAYWPMSSHESYQATNYIGKQDWCMFVAMDENWNIF